MTYGACIEELRAISRSQVKLIEKYLAEIERKELQYETFLENLELFKEHINELFEHFEFELNAYDEFEYFK
mgnify:CR=1 FL=1